ncbi:hypothetical protein QH494_19420 [Sphingomonas sp. AR_OL41]|jgi:hypothetical protein|uniref:hypothetical protein n=1 Tax=Sphingomonas sp. AR_OL41 TaxID=3042729 RepID=UPI002480D7C2|nr:hypothetical protein [Sphingomonas sp. AR_OL41]MDH7974365.1 hypothetical protein [Sphingomonas sp. AR_OL41]
MRARTEAPPPDKAQYEAWARRARALADEATTGAARAIHIAIAEDYEAKAARSAQPALDDSISPAEEDSVSR